MFLRKLLLTSVACLAITINHSYSMDIKEVLDTDNDTKIVPDAAYFIIHTSSYCYQYFMRKGIAIPAMPISSTPTDRCTHCCQIITSEETIVSYHDKNFELITHETITKPELLTQEVLAFVKQPQLAGLALQKTALLSYLKQRLDPAARPKATSAIIEKKDGGTNILFFNDKNDLIHWDRYPKKSSPKNKNDLNEFESHVDLSNLAGIQDHRNKRACCTLF